MPRCNEAWPVSRISGFFYQATVNTPAMVLKIPGQGWYTILRLYGPLEAWFDKTWRPGEIELVK